MSKTVTVKSCSNDSFAEKLLQEKITSLSMCKEFIWRSVNSSAHIVTKATQAKGLCCNTLEKLTSKKNSHVTNADGNSLPTSGCRSTSRRQVWCQIHSRARPVARDLYQNPWCSSILLNLTRSKHGDAKFVMEILRANISCSLTSRKCTNKYSFYHFIEFLNFFILHIALFAINIFETS